MVGGWVSFRSTLTFNFLVPVIHISVNVIVRMCSATKRLKVCCDSVNTGSILSAAFDYEPF